MVTLRGNNNTGVSSGGGTTARIIPASLPTKLEYVEGEALDTSGLTLNFEEVGSEPSSISTFSTIPNNGTNLTRHNESIQVDYKNDGKIYSLNIPIKVKYPVGLRVNYLKKNNYNIDESIDLAGADIVIVYNDNSEKSIENNTGVTTTPTTYDGSSKLIKFSYSDGSIELNTNYEINKSKELAGYVDPRIVTFASGSWEDIDKMLTRHFNGEINITDYWKVGDERQEENINIQTVDLNNNNNNITLNSGRLIILGFNNTTYGGTHYSIAIGLKSLLISTVVGYNDNKFRIYSSTNTIHYWDFGYNGWWIHSGYGDEPEYTNRYEESSIFKTRMENMFNTTGSFGNNNPPLVSEIFYKRIKKEITSKVQNLAAVKKIMISQDNAIEFRPKDSNNKNLVLFRNYSVVYKPEKFENDVVKIYRNFALMHHNDLFGSAAFDYFKSTVNLSKMGEFCTPELVIGSMNTEESTDGFRFSDSRHGSQSGYNVGVEYKYRHIKNGNLVNEDIIHTPKKTMDFSYTSFSRDVEFYKKNNIKFMAYFLI